MVYLPPYTVRIHTFGLHQCHILSSHLEVATITQREALMLCMFVYDVVMVFVTPFLTRSGCSVMVEVAAGTICSSSGNDGYPMLPFPMLMQVPHFDPMISCVDLDIEKGFHMIMLGLGDIIIPAKEFTCLGNFLQPVPRIDIVVGRGMCDYA
ncbi:hypothetical protein COOONC_26647 [Cooperia oncophora]